MLHSDNLRTSDIESGKMTTVNELLPATLERYRELIKAVMPASAATLDEAPADARAVYRSLFLYGRLARFRRDYERLDRLEFGKLEETLRAECEALESATRFERIDPTSLWAALTLFVAGKVFIRDAWTDLAADAFGRVARGQQENGRLLNVTASDNPESSWYDELAALHAAASYAVQAEDRTVARAVSKGSEFVQREIEPDHATGQPWGLFAFIWNPSTRPLADQLLHSAQMRKDRLDSGSLILLEDALYCLDLFLR